MPRMDQDDDDSTDDASLNDMAEEAADEMLELESQDNIPSEHLQVPMMASSQWLAALDGRARDKGKVKGHFEWEYFKSNVFNFRGRGDSDEADNYSGYRWSEFATSWNAWVDSLGATKPEVTYKTSAYLQEAFKLMKRRGVQDSTLREHSQGLNSLRERHTNMDTNQQFVPEFAMPQPPTIARPTIMPVQILPCPVGVAVGTQDANNGAVATLAGGDHDEDDDPRDTRTAYQVAISDGSQRKRQKITKKQHRCRRCGHEYASDKWKKFHVDSDIDRSQEGPRSRFLRNASGRKVWDLCTVPLDLKCELYTNFDYADMNKRVPRKRCSGCKGCNASIGERS